MKRARFTEEQIIAVLKEHGAGAKTADLARKHGISEATIYNWKAKFGGMDVSGAKRLGAFALRLPPAFRHAGAGERAVNASSISMPTAPRPPPCAPISCV